MGLLSSVVLLPLAPLRGTIWIAERLADYAAEQLDDERAIRRLLLEAEAALDAGDLTEAEFDRIEDELLDRLEVVQTGNEVMI